MVFTTHIWGLLMVRVIFPSDQFWECKAYVREYPLNKHCLTVHVSSVYIYIIWRQHLFHLLCWSRSICVRAARTALAMDMNGIKKWFHATEPRENGDQTLAPFYEHENKLVNGCSVPFNCGRIVFDPSPYRKTWNTLKYCNLQQTYSWLKQIPSLTARIISNIKIIKDFNILNLNIMTHLWKSITSSPFPQSLRNVYKTRYSHWSNFSISAKRRGARSEPPMITRTSVQFLNCAAVMERKSISNGFLMP